MTTILKLKVCVAMKQRQPSPPLSPPSPSLSLHLSHLVQYLFPFQSSECVSEESKYRVSWQLRGNVTVACASIILQ